MEQSELCCACEQVSPSVQTYPCGCVCICTSCCEKGWCCRTCALCGAPVQLAFETKIRLVEAAPPYTHTLYVRVYTYDEYPGSPETAAADAAAVANIVHRHAVPDPPCACPPACGCDPRADTRRILYGEIDETNKNTQILLNCAGMRRDALRAIGIHIKGVPVRHKADLSPIAPIVQFPALVPIGQPGLAVYGAANILTHLAALLAPPPHQP